LAGTIGVIARRAADRPGAAAQPLDEQGVGAGTIGQPILREDADLDIDRPAIIRNQRLDRVEAAHADRRIDLDLGAHPRRSVEDALFESVRGAVADVGDAKVLFDRGDLPHRIDPAARLGRQAIDEPRLVEMDVGLDQPGAGEPPLGVPAVAPFGQSQADCGDLALGDADVDRFRVRPVGESCIADDQIHAASPRA
jgi:hypothetical protein